MRIHHLFCTSSLTILAAFSSAAQTNLLSSGSFELGGRMTTIPGISFSRNPTDHAGRMGLQFYSNDSGFAILDVSVAEKP